MNNRILKIRISYETNRFSEKFLSEAYQRFVPKIKKQIEIKDIWTTASEELKMGSQ